MAYEQWYRLPLGQGETKDVEEYCRQWDAVYRAAEELFPGFKSVALTHDYRVKLQMRSVDKEKNTYTVLDEITILPVAVFGLMWHKAKGI